MLHVYSKAHYETKIKAVFVAEWEKVRAEWDERGEDEDEDEEEELEEPVELDVRNRVTKECWDKETPSFRQRIEEEVLHRHATDVAEWEAAKEMARSSGDDRTPQDYHK